MKLHNIISLSILVAFAVLSLTDNASAQAFGEISAGTDFLEWLSTQVALFVVAFFLILACLMYFIFQSSFISALAMFGCGIVLGTVIGAAIEVAQLVVGA